MESDLDQSNRVFCIISDIEMSCGGALDDFPQTDYLKAFFEQYSSDKYKDKEIDLVFNGDTFDFLKTQVDGEYPHLIDREIALKKLELIATDHADFFEGLKNFLDYPGRPRRVHFIYGNHDPELLFPEVQNKIISLCGGSGQIFFPGFEMTVSDLQIEHGAQQDSLFHIPPDKPFLHHQGRKVLNLPWASVTLLNVFMPLRPLFHDLDRIKPKRALFKKMPELKEWMLASLWNYWTRDYIREYLKSSDPLKKISWTMIREAFRRSVAFNPEVEMESYYQNRMKKSESIRTYVIGHAHLPQIWSYGNRRVVQSGCFRNEFMLNSDNSYSLIQKSYVEVLFKNNQVLTSNLQEFAGPELPRHMYPKPLSEYAPLIKEKLGPKEKRMKEKKAIEAQEEKEKREES